MHKTGVCMRVRHRWLFGIAALLGLMAQPAFADLSAFMREVWASEDTKRMAKRVFVDCELAMANQTCQALSSGQKSTLATLPRTSQVFIAGIGAVDAQAYWQIADQGDNMCAYVRNACLDSSQHPVCQLGRQLF